MKKSHTIDDKRLLESMERTLRKFKVKDLVKTWVDDGPAFGIVIEIHRFDSGTNYDILVNGEIHRRPANYVVKPDEECPQFLSFSGITMPNLKRVYPTLMANEMLSVQPMTMPSGLIQYIDHTYGEKDNDEND